MNYYIVFAVILFGHNLIIYFNPPGAINQYKKNQTFQAFDGPPLVFTYVAPVVFILNIAIHLTSFFLV